MSELEIPAGSPFDEIRQTRPDGSEYWSARDLMALMGYAAWQNFQPIVEKAWEGAKHVGVGGVEHFMAAHKVAASGPAAKDVHLSRLAAYLVTLAADEAKPRVAEAKLYFAVKTRQAETREVSLFADPLEALEAANTRMSQALQIARAERTAREQAERDVEALAPAAAAWDHLASADGDWSVADAAKILSRDPNIKTGQNRLFTLLYEWGWIFRGGDLHWRVNQSKAVDTRRLTVLPASHYHPKTGQLVQDPPQIRVLPKGLVEMHRRLGGSQPLAVQQQLTIEAA